MSGTVANLDSVTCTVCQELLKDPVALHCGHNYCMSCIKNCWDEEDQKGVYSCPQCRHTFTPRPVLFKNPLIAELVENVKKTRLQAAPPALCYAGPGDVECDVCTGRKVKAVKSCLVCLVSYCETHFKVHNEVNPGGKHTVTDATGQLQEKICSQHHKLLEVFCRTDKSLICFHCTMDDHKNHDTVSAPAVKMGNKKLLVEKEQELQELREAVETLKRSAQAAVMDSEKIFTQMIHSIEKMRSEVCKMIRDQEKAELSLAEGRLELLEQEIIDLRRRDAELEQLSHTEDHIHFLQRFPSLCAPPGSKDLPNITVNQNVSFDPVIKSVSNLKERLEDFSKQEINRVSAAVINVQILLYPEPKTRDDFIQYACALTLDPNTAYNQLSLSEEGRTVTGVPEELPYPDGPERFRHGEQVLCREALCTRCYWEMEWSGFDVYVAVTYKGISRTRHGCDGWLGQNVQSWSLQCADYGYGAYHNNDHTHIPVPSTPSNRVGVYLDWTAGTLSFYSVSSGRLTHLHTFHATFTEPLYPGFGFSMGTCSSGSTVSLCKLK
ncbi:tripartite motif-containing protein 16-like protein [Denticeps clupeoides]|uniref:tripartite motif-containing protein 16-like protein n=1 Tax=Denticeps clupeoides TaxID=299321 RepID=UPI0010A4ED3A|nr:tripartite motif-containing protein 16-like protein [Denticeps clupeoides]